MVCGHGEVVCYVTFATFLAKNRAKGALTWRID